MFGCMEEGGRKDKKKKDFFCLAKMKMRKWKEKNEKGFCEDTIFSITKLL